MNLEKPTHRGSERAQLKRYDQGDLNKAKTVCSFASSGGK